MSAEPPPLDDAEYQGLARFRHALRAFVRFSEQAARAAGLTPAQHQLLLAVRGCEQGPPAPMAVVAEMLQLRLHSVVELADRAEARGLIERVVDPEDHRRVLLTLTREGQAKLAELSVLHRDELRRFRTVMGPLLDAFDDGE